MKLFWGKPANPGEIRFLIATLLGRTGRAVQDQFNSHEIVGLYGAQIGLSFIGIIRLGRWGFSSVDRKALEADDGGR